MEPQNLNALLQNNPYPGRGIVLGLTEDKTHAFVAYFIMGRSENSRNRVFEKAGTTVKTAAANPAKLADPSLIIYTAMAMAGERLVVTNGDQTDTILAALAKGQRFEDALRSRTFEPDAPNYTPRISGMVTAGAPGFSYQLSILKGDGGTPPRAQRFFFDYPEPAPGVGHFIHTYAGQEGGRLASFAGEPVPVALKGTPEEIGDGLWASLCEENVVALAVATLSLGGQADIQLYNKYNKI